MLNRQLLEEALSQLPLYTYHFLDPKTLEFADRIRWICQHDCPMYGRSWACPPGVGTVAQCEKKCKDFEHCLMISTITEVSDIADIEATLQTRPQHEAITNEVRDLMRQQNVEPYILSTDSCALCESCAYCEGKPCRASERMHPCVESHGINIIPTLEENGLEFQYGDNIITWYSLLFF